MLQGTSSHVGKSILTTALCRIFLQDDYKVVPFKAQNMALNSYVTKTGEEMGRAQVAQAEAAGLEPVVEMNPVLLKPTGNSTSQVILLGKPVGTMSAKEYHNGYSLTALGVVEKTLEKLSKEYELVVIEGAGSPAEVNLKANDIVNMRVAKLLNAPVLLIADIDRGGALASIVGTLELLEPDERDLVKGLIINKFRGDITLLKPALDFLEEKTGKPVLGVIPHLDNLGIDDEDSVSLEDKNTVKNIDQQAEIEIAVLRTPKISNFTDFDSLEVEPDVNLRYVKQGEAIGNPDLIILPGSKNTSEDLLYLRTEGYEKELLALAQQGTPIIGICGGYQMLGEQILDPDGVESDQKEIRGLGLLPIVTTLSLEKITRQVQASCEDQHFLGEKITCENFSGYEIHAGRTEFLNQRKSAFQILTDMDSLPDGMINSSENVLGTYLHGVFDQDQYRTHLLKILHQRKNGGTEKKEVLMNYQEKKEEQYRNLSKTIRGNLDIELIKNLHF